MDRLERLAVSAASLTGLAYSELLEQTPSRLNAMVVAVQIEGGACLKPDVAKMQVQYAVTLNEIRERLARERATSQALPGGQGR